MDEDYFGDSHWGDDSESYEYEYNYWDYDFPIMKAENLPEGYVLFDRAG